MPVSPLSIAGLVAVILVIAAGHVAVARYDVMAYELVNCVFSEDGGDGCGDADRSAHRPARRRSPTDSADPGASRRSRRQPDRRDPHARPVRAGHAGPHPAALGRQGAAQHPRVGVDAREGDGTSFNTDTLIVVSIDPETKQVAMFQVPRDMVDVPVPDNARSPVGLRVRRQDQQLVQPEPQPRRTCGRARPPRPAASTRSRRILGELYGLDIRYYVKVDFEGFRDVVNTIGGVQVNVQMPGLREQVPAPARATSPGSTSPPARST